MFGTFTYNKLSLKEAKENGEIGIAID